MASRNSESIFILSRSSLGYDFVTFHILAISEQLLNLSGMLINDSPVLSYSYYLPPTFIRMMGAHLEEELEPLPEVGSLVK